MPAARTLSSASSASPPPLRERVGQRHQRLLETGNRRRTVPAARPTCPSQPGRCAMPVLMIGSMPVGRTSRTSMPVGAPPNRGPGSRSPGSRAAVISSISLVILIASPKPPAPTYGTTAGAAAMQNAPDADRLGDRRVANVRVAVRRRVAAEVEPLRRVDRRREPAVAGPAQPHPELDAVPRHRRDQAALGAGRVAGVGDRLAGRHRHVQEELVGLARRTPPRPRAGPRAGRPAPAAARPRGAAAASRRRSAGASRRPSSAPGP